MADNDSREDLIKRLKRIEGQIRGIQRMVEQDRACGEILAQLSAANEAVRSVSALLAERYALECLDSHERPKKGATKPRETVAALIDALMRAPR
jgi:CsoR family transcriptional regulator, copper-sensing transcriptional repressor